MAKWRVNEMSKLTGVSVRMLHHYDEIGLLKPSLRTANNYRWYAPEDLAKLQQIVALRFFGLSLNQIKALFGRQHSLSDHLKAQEVILKKQLAHLEQAVTVLSRINNNMPIEGPLDWQDFITLIERYRMNTELKHEWLQAAYSPEQVKLFKTMEQQNTQDELRDYEQKWQFLFDQIERNSHIDPQSEIGKFFATEWAHLVNEKYAQFPELKEAAYLAYKKGLIPESACKADVMQWIEKAFLFHKIKK